MSIINMINITTKSRIYQQITDTTVNRFGAFTYESEESWRLKSFYQGQMILCKVHRAIEEAAIDWCANEKLPFVVLMTSSSRNITQHNNYVCYRELVL